MFSWDAEGDADFVVVVNEDLIDEQPQDIPALLLGQVVQTVTEPPGPFNQVLHEQALLRRHRLPGAEVVQRGARGFQSLGDEPPLLVELVLGDLARHVQSDGPLLLDLDLLEVALGSCDLVGDAAVIVGVEGLDARHYKLGVLDHLLDLVPHQLLQLLGPDHCGLPAIHVLSEHPVAVVVPLRGDPGLLADLALPPEVGVGGGAAGEHQPALGAADEVLEQIEYLGVALGSHRPLLLDGLSAVPCLLVHQGRERHLDPPIFRLRVDSLSGLRHDPAGLAVVPGALVDFPAENGADVCLVPPGAGISQGGVVAGHPFADWRPGQTLVHVHLEDAPNDLGLRLVYLRLAVVSGTIPVGGRSGGHPALLGRAALAHGGPLPEVVQLYLADGGHEAEGLHVDGVGDGFELYLMSLDHFHEGGGRVHAPAEAVGLPADDGVEAFPPSVGQHPLELRALLGPSPAHLLVSGGYGQPLALAVGFHLACLLGDGGLVVLGLALVRHAGVDGRALAVYSFSRPGSRHDCLLMLTFPETKKDPSPVGAGLRVVQSIRIACFRQVAPRPGMFAASPGQPSTTMIPRLAGWGQRSVTAP